MLDALKFVQRGVARRDIVPNLTNFRIENGRVTGYNGTIALSAPVDIGFNAAPQAGSFIRALDACDDVISITQESTSRLIVRSGNFRSAVPCIDVKDVPVAAPEGVIVTPHTSILHALEVLNPFIGIDASRKWACGILLAGSSAYATNNVVLAEYWLGVPFPYVVNVPSVLVDEVLLVKEELTAIQLTESSITFHYADGRWIKSQLISTEWPDVNRALNGSWKDARLIPVPRGLAEACNKISRFGSKDECFTYFRGTDVSTMKEGTLDGGALVELSGIPDFGCYHSRYLNDMLAAAEQVDFTMYPRPVPFAGQNLRGVLLGRRA